MSIFSKIKQTFRLMKDIDLDALGELSQKVDLSEIMKTVGELDDRQLQGLMKMLKHKSGKKGQHKLPPIDGDFYDLSLKLTPQQRELQLKVRNFMEDEIRPIANEYWNKAEFPFEIIPKMAALNICGLTIEGYETPNESSVMEGIIAMEMARVDVSISTFFGVHSGLAMSSINICGSEAQKKEWLPKMARMEVIGAFGLTEPDVGSAVAGGMGTTCRREGDEWILNGQKKWIGNATFADVTVIWANDEETNRVKGFLVRKGNPGFKAEKIEGKMALRTVQNALITLTNCRVPESDRLQKCDSFKDTAKVLKVTRAAVAWQAVGCARGAYESALKYTKKREQFGKPIASFQLVQNHLVEMLANLTAMQTMCFRLSELQDEDLLTDEHASLAKVFCSLRTRDVVRSAREVMGGNGILLEYDVARFVADAEAIYSYEGTKEINTLIVGRAITGYGAFV